MSKYNYKRDVFKGLNPFPFLGEVKTRIQNIEAAPDTVPESVFNPNKLGAKLHPSVQYGVVSEIIPDANAKTFVFVPDKEMGCNSFAYFRAGQYISIALDINGCKCCKPYTLSSCPCRALGDENNAYAITVKNARNGFASDYILNNWTVGTKITFSAPLGNFYYTSLRDAKNVVALAGGSGITPFVSMAHAIAGGVEDFNLTILYGSNTEDSIILKNDLEEVIPRAGGKVKLVNVLSEEEKEGFEHGFITAELIKKYAPDDDYSVFVCGPKAMYKFAENEIAKLGLKDRRVRFELSGEYGTPVNDEKYPGEKESKQYKLKVLVRGESFEAVCASDESILVACEKAGICVPSDCRSGECGWCHSRLISGDVYVPEKADKRRIADKKFGWIHPCITYPLSDIEIEVFTMI